MDDNEMKNITSVLIENKKLKEDNEALRVAAHFICDDDVEVNLRNQVYQQQLKLQQLEAERSELRNKVIVAMEELKRMKMMKDDIENEIEQLKIIDDLLNSLKTK